MLTAEIDYKQIEAIKKRFDNITPEKQGSLAYRAFIEMSLFVERGLKQEVSGSSLNVKTGRLRTSIGSKVSLEADGLSAVIGSGVRSGKRLPYANIHEDGGTITPKKGKYLTIPIGDNKRKDGLARFSASELINGYKTFLLPTNRGKVLMAIIAGTPKPMFALVTSVRIPGTKYMSITLKNNLKAVLNIFVNSIEKGLSHE
jgi:phage gpG-like protein